MFGTKCPSITSRWIQSAPAASTARTSSPSLAKSDARMDGAITRGRGAKGWDMAVPADSTASPNMRNASEQSGPALFLIGDFLPGDFAKAVAIPNMLVEEGPARERGLECVGHILRHVVVDVAPPCDE